MSEDFFKEDGLLSKAGLGAVTGPATVVTMQVLLTAATALLLSGFLNEFTNEITEETEVRRGPLDRRRVIKFTRAMTRYARALDKSDYPARARTFRLFPDPVLNQWVPQAWLNVAALNAYLELSGEVDEESAPPVSDRELIRFGSQGQ